MLSLVHYSVDACISCCLQNAHCAAILIGAVCYVGYSALTSIKLPTKRKVEEHDDEDDSCAASVWSSLPRYVHISIVIASLALTLLMMGGIAWQKQHEGVCAAWRQTLGERPWNWEEHASRIHPVEDVDNNTIHCSIIDANLSEHCVASLEANAARPPALTPEVETARRSTAAFTSLCKSSLDGLRLLRLGKAQRLSIVKAMRALMHTKSVENYYREHLDRLTKGALSARAAVTGAGKLAPASRKAAVQDQLRELKGLRSQARSQVVELVLEARQLVAAVPHSDAYMQQAISCEPRLLGALEELALAEAEQDTDASVLFKSGLYLSELGVASTTLPFFATHLGIGDFSEAAAPSSGWSSDASMGGTSHKVPAALAKAEALMLKGEEASLDERQRTERGAQRALRLYQHAKSLALMHHDGAAEARYLEAAKVAAANQRQQLAAHALTRLSYFLSLRSQQRRALELSEQALTHWNDPLAQYLKASMQRTLGELRSGVDVAAAEALVSSLTERLPSESLEKERASMHHDLELWRYAAAEGGLGVCFALGDSARFLLCAFCKVIFDAVPPPEPQLALAAMEQAALSSAPDHHYLALSDEVM